MGIEWRLIQTRGVPEWLSSDLVGGAVEVGIHRALAGALDVVTGGRGQRLVTRFAGECGILASAESLERRQRVHGEVSISPDTGFGLRVTPFAETGADVWRDVGRIPGDGSHVSYATIVLPRTEVALPDLYHIDARLLFEYFEEPVPRVVAYMDPMTRIGLVALSLPEDLPHAPLLFEIVDDRDGLPSLRLWHLPVEPAPDVTQRPTPQWIDDCRDCGEPRLVQHTDTRPVRLRIEGDVCTCDTDRLPAGERVTQVVVRLRRVATHAAPTRRESGQEPRPPSTSFPKALRSRYEVNRTLDRVAAEVRVSPPADQRAPSERPADKNASSERPADQGAPAARHAGQGAPAARPADRHVLAARPSDQGVGASNIQAPDPDSSSRSTAFAACDVLAAIAEILDEVRAWLGRMAGRAVEAVIKLTGAPDPAAALAGSIVEKAVSGHLLRPLRSMARVVRLAGTTICATQGRPLRECQCARELAKDLVKQAAMEHAHDVSARAAVHFRSELYDSVRAQAIVPADLRLPTRQEADHEIPPARTPPDAVDDEVNLDLPTTVPSLGGPAVEPSPEGPTGHRPFGVYKTPQPFPNDGSDLGERRATPQASGLAEIASRSPAQRSPEPPTPPSGTVAGIAL